MDNHEVNKNTDVISYMEEYATSNPTRKWMCKHYHRERISEEQGENEKRPKEEFYSYDIPRNSIMAKYRPQIITEDISSEKVGFYDVKKSDLIPISDDECQCSKCGKKFPVEKIKQMEKLFQRINELADIDNEYIYLRDLQFLELTKGIEPVWYYEKADGSIEVLAEKTNPRDWVIGGREKSLLSDDIIGRNYVKNESANLFCNIPEESEWLGKNKDICKHYWGMAYWILRESAWKLPRFVGEAESKLVTDESGVCKCSECHKIFSEEEQFKMS